MMTVMLALLVAFGCSKDAARSDGKANNSKPKTEASVLPSVKPNANPPNGDQRGAAATEPGDDDEVNGGGTGRGQGGGGKSPTSRSMVYVDGVPLASLRFRELPPGLKPQCRELEDGHQSCRYRVFDYLAKLGVPLGKVRRVDLYGGRDRVVRIDGDELRRAKDYVLFSFAAEEGGKARCHWTGPVRKSSELDVLGDVAVYVDRIAPTWNDQSRGLELDGKPVVGIPYADPSIGKGVRVYVDGRIVAYLKKKLLPESAKLPPIPDEDEQRWKLGDSLTGLGVALKGIKAGDLIEEDAFITRLDIKQLANSAFVVIPQSGGLIEVAPFRREISAILLYRNSKPPPVP